MLHTARIRHKDSTMPQNTLNYKKPFPQITRIWRNVGVKPRVWLVIGGILLFVLLVELFALHEPGLSGFGFYAWYGFLSSLGLALIAKVIGLFLKRRDTYYDD